MANQIFYPFIQGQYMSDRGMTAIRMLESGYTIREIAEQMTVPVDGMTDIIALGIRSIEREALNEDRPVAQGFAPGPFEAWLWQNPYASLATIRQKMQLLLPLKEALQGVAWPRGNTPGQP